METSHVAANVEASRRSSRRVLVVSALGPVTALAGVVWAIAQPYRLALLHPDGAGFWRLAVEAPLLVVLVGALFHFAVAPGLVDDLTRDER